MNTQSPLGSVSVEQFFAEYWQKKPLLVRQAFPGFISPISPEELAGYALEEDITSRLIIETPTDDPLHSLWQVKHGPFPETVFAELPEKHWTLLVQNLDSFNEAANQLLQSFRFLPNWRLDDVMASYASMGGGVGPHFDYYDVFLLQGLGSRRWKLGQICDAQSPLLPDVAMQILTEFDTNEEWVLEPGDMLYLPPQLAHWGTAASDNCITYSIGFRAPSHEDILLDFCQEASSFLLQDQRYTDIDLKPTKYCGEIPCSAISQVQNILQTYTGDTGKIAEWFGKYMTQPNMDTEFSPISPMLFDELTATNSFQLSPHVRAAYFQLPDEQCMLFINGMKWLTNTALASGLSAYQTLYWSKLTKEQQAVIAELCEYELLIENRGE